MTNAVLQFILSGLGIILAGWYLVGFADQIADRTRLGRLFVGSVFLAAATSLPELSVDIQAVRNNMPDLAVGDLIGSSLFNLLILAFADLMHKGPSRFFSKSSSQHALSAAMSINLTAIVAIAIYIESIYPLPSVFDIGAGTLFVALSYTLGIRLILYNQKTLLVTDLGGGDANPAARSLWKALTGYIITATVILMLAPFLSDAGGAIAELSGLGKTFIGTTLIALTTSLPELVSTLAAVRRGSFDLAIGNIFGSNTFNMLLLIPLDFAFSGSLLAVVSSMHILTCLSTVLITSVAVMGQLYQVEEHKRLIEPDAFAVICLVILTLYGLYLFSGLH